MSFTILDYSNCGEATEYVDIARDDRKHLREQVLEWALSSCGALEKDASHSDHGKSAVADFLGGKIYLTSFSPPKFERVE